MKSNDLIKQLQQDAHYLYLSLLVITLIRKIRFLPAFLSPNAQWEMD